MCATFSDLINAGPPPARVAILPDALFFARAVAVGASATDAEAAGEASMALEANSPFPLSQVYHGHYRAEGSERVLAYAAYRRRFTADQAAAWAGAELVLPAFAAMLGAKPGPDTTLVVASGEGLTAIHWDRSETPAAVLHRHVPSDTPKPERDRVLRELASAAGGGRVVEVPAPEAVAADRDGDFAFRAGEVRSVFPAAKAAYLDVRDKGELASLGRARRRDLVLWRVTLGSLAACLVFAALEILLLLGGAWQSARRAKVLAQKPTVAHIMDEQDLALRIDDLSTKRLLPLEMISAVAPEGAMPKAPPAIQFLHASTNVLNTIQVEAQTNNPGEIAGYKAALEQSPLCEKVEIRDQRQQNNVVTFTIVVTFRTGALSPASS